MARWKAAGDLATTTPRSARIPRTWLMTAVQAIQFKPYDDYGAGDAYGYHWWVLKYGPPGGGGEPVWVAAARGAGGQKIFVIPAFDAVFVTTALNYRDPFDTSKLLRRFVLPALTGGGKPWEWLGVGGHELGLRLLEK